LKGFLKTFAPFWKWRKVDKRKEICSTSLWKKCVSANTEAETQTRKNFKFGEDSIKFAVRPSEKRPNHIFFETHFFEDWIMVIPQTNPSPRCSRPRKPNTHRGSTKLHSNWCPVSAVTPLNDGIMHIIVNVLPFYIVTL
jgi:hypothetical protein